VAHPRPVGIETGIEGTGTEVYGGSGSSGMGGGAAGPGKIGNRIACLGDESTHNYRGKKGYIFTTGTDIYGNDTCIAEGLPVAIEGALHNCPVPGHGIQKINAITIKSYYQGKLILTEGAVVDAPCGAVIKPQNRKIYVE